MVQRICHWVFFKRLGWRQIGDAPLIDKYILVAVPHTSNWDFVYGWMAVKALGLPMTIFVKDVFFFWPLSYICRAMNLAPVNRSERTNFVDSIVAEYSNRRKLIAFITPEGTRKFVSNLKSGYYHIAIKANIPIVVAGPDFANRTFTLKPPRMPLASFAEDQADVMSFCRTMNAHTPRNTFQ